MLNKVKRVFGATKSVMSGPEVAAGEAENLLVWWEGDFSPEEQNYILTKYKPMMLGVGTKGERTVPNHIIRSDGTLGPISSLAALSNWFLTGDDILLARRILAKSAERQESETGSVVDRHFIYGHMIKVYYRDRNRDENALALAIQTCEQQIAIAPQVVREWPSEWGKTLPAHQGFEQLTIILERNGDYEGAIRLSKEAQRQGWAGDWAKRITRCEQRSKR